MTPQFVALLELIQQYDGPVKLNGTDVRINYPDDPMVNLFDPYGGGWGDHEDGVLIHALHLDAEERGWSLTIIPTENGRSVQLTTADKLINGTGEDEDFSIAWAKAWTNAAIQAAQLAITA